MTTAIDGTIVRVNATFCDWIGFRADELLRRKRIQDLLGVGGKVFHQTHWAPLLQLQRSVAEVKLEVRHRDGQRIPMLINAVRRREGEREYDHFALVVVNDRDKYERELLATRERTQAALEAKHRAEQALQLADRRKDEFIATLAHELRNPLAPVEAVIELLRTKRFADEQVIWCRGVLERQIGHMARLVEDLLEGTRLAEGKLEFRTRRIELAPVILQAIEGSRGLIDTSGHRLEIELPPNAIFLDADPVRLLQIVQNLLNNAAKYTLSGGTITVQVTREDDCAVIRVRDTGIGIDAEHLLSIFGIFAQLPSGLSRSRGGLGIGLSLVRALTERHGGSVSASSAGIDRGSEFVVRLPAASGPAPAIEAPVVEATASVTSLDILIVDDNLDACLSLAMLLDCDGHSTRTAPDGATLERLASEAPPDVILLDIGLPDSNGYELARRIRRRPGGDKLLLIALTGWGGEHDKQEALAAGFDSHFTKPVDYQRLSKTLRDFRKVS